MWCIETLNLLNQKTQEFAGQKRPITEAKKYLGIRVDMVKHDVRPRPIKSK